MKKDKNDGKKITDKQNLQVKLLSEKMKERDKKIRIVKIAILIMALFLIIIYFILRVFLETGDFTISLDQEFAKSEGIIMYENSSNKIDRRILKAQKVEFMDNISVKWLPQDIDKTGEGAHNGDNYLAYTFYLENKGAETVNYWYEVKIDEVIKNVDEAVRIAIYRNGERTIYAKPNSRTGEAEDGTTKFYSASSVCVEPRRDFKPGDIDRFTIVIFIEGDDPECQDNLIGGEMKMHMDITQERIDQKKDKIITNVT